MNTRSRRTDLSVPCEASDVFLRKCHLSSGMGEFAVEPFEMNHKGDMSILCHLQVSPREDRPLVE